MATDQGTFGWIHKIRDVLLPWRELPDFENVTNRLSLRDDYVTQRFHRYTEDTGWKDASGLLVNSWVSYDSNWGPPQYRRIGRQVFLTGLVKSGSATLIFTLPEGFRPEFQFLTASHSGEPHTLARLDVLENGEVHQSSGLNGYMSIHCTFLVDPKVVQ